MAYVREYGIIKKPKQPVGQYSPRQYRLRSAAIPVSHNPAVTGWSWSCDSAVSVKVHSVVKTERLLDLE